MKSKCPNFCVYCKEKGHGVENCEFLDKVKQEKNAGPSGKRDGD